MNYSLPQAFKALFRGLPLRRPGGSHSRPALLFRLVLALALWLPSTAARADWRDNTELLIYSPRYFGPNAFPLPPLRSAQAPTRYEVELRGEYHHFRGDKTKDLYARVLLPFVKGRAGLEVSLVIIEKYKMTPQTRDDRFAVETESPIPCHGDVVVSSYFQVIKSRKWADVMITANLKTASGGRLCDARYTDAAAYWFDLTAGRDLWQNADATAKVRLQGMVGFYCWMTNNLIHRQNDALSYGIGLSGTYRPFTLSADLSGFHGYKDNGDRPLQLRTRLAYEIKKNIVALRYHHGMKDSLYDTWSLGYTRCF